MSFVEDAIQPLADHTNQTPRGWTSTVPSGAQAVLWLMGPLNPQTQENSWCTALPDSAFNAISWESDVSHDNEEALFREPDVSRSPAHAA